MKNNIVNIPLEKRNCDVCNSKKLESLYKYEKNICNGESFDYFPIEPSLAFRSLCKKASKLIIFSRRHEQAILHQINFHRSKNKILDVLTVDINP